MGETNIRRKREEEEEKKREDFSTTLKAQVDGGGEVQFK